MRVGAGIGFMLLTACCFATSDASAKFLGADIPILVLLWVRYLFQTSVMVAVQLKRRPWREMLKSGRLSLQALRAALLCANASCSFAGLQLLPLAEFTALAMLAPMFSTLLAATVLHERVTPLRWAMVLLGFIGMLVIVQPGHGTLGWPAALPVVAAALFALFQVTTNRLSTVDGIVTTNLISAIGALVILTAALLVSPLHTFAILGRASLGQCLLMGLLGIAATGGQLSMTMAIRSAPLSVLTPFAYVQIAFAATIGWLLFGHRPGGAAVFGMGLIMVAGAATIWLHARESKAFAQASRLAG
jgi:drug/metabolite transporter (DMT)-like permease